jgi:hypothetical protein
LPQRLHLLPEGGKEDGELGPDVGAVGDLREPERVLGLLEVPTGGHQRLVVLLSAWIGARAGRLAVFLDLTPSLGDLYEGLVTPLPQGYERGTLRHQSLILGAVALPGGMAGIPEITLGEDDRTQGCRPLCWRGLLLQGRLVLIDAIAPGLALFLAFALHAASLHCFSLGMRPLEVIPIDGAMASCEADGIHGPHPFSLPTPKASIKVHNPQPLSASTRASPFLGTARGSSAMGHAS